jgi:hypothetical protein
MKKLLTFMTVLILALAVFIAPSQAAFKDMWAKVYSWDGSINASGRLELTEITSGVTYVVFMANSSATLETLYRYNNDAYTALGNPVTGTNFASDSISGDRVAFRVDPTETNDTAVDLIVVDQAGGYTAFVEDFDEYTHSIVIDQRPNVRHHGVAFLVSTDSSAETDTGIDFDDDVIIDKGLIEIGTAMAGGTTPLVSVGILSSGTNGDADGFILGASLATAGYHNPLRAGVDLTSYSVTSGEAYGVINLGYAGTFLGHLGAGSADTQTLIPQGMIVPDQLLIHGSWENSLTYTFPTSHVSTGWAMFHFWFTRIR